MQQPTYSQAAALTVGTPNPETINAAPVTGILCVVTVTGNAVFKLSDGASVTVSLAVGTVILPLSVIEVVSSAATATYTQLG